MRSSRLVGPAHHARQTKNANNASISRLFFVDKDASQFIFIINLLNNYPTQPQNNMRRRHQDSDSTPEVDILDSDDQDQIISRFSKEMDEQQRGINQSFRALCIGSAALSVLALLFLEMRESILQTGRFFRWIHALITATLHLATSLVALPSTPTTRLKWILVLPWVLTLILGSSSLFHARSIKGEDSTVTVTYHQGLLIGNFLTTLAALWLRSDSASMQRSVDKLREARYRHKTL